MRQFPKRSDNTTKKTFPRLCPRGTVLIRRITKEDLIRARKYARMQLQQAQITDTSGGDNHVRFILT